MMDDGIELDDQPPGEGDPRIRETVEYATSGVELVLNAEFLLDEWVTAALLRDSYMSFIYRRYSMTPEQKFLLVAENSWISEEDDSGGKEAYGFLLDLYRLRARAGRLSDEELTSSILESVDRHWGDEESEGQEPCYIPIMEARRVVALVLAFAEVWLSTIDDEGLSHVSEDLPQDYPDWAVWEEEYNPVTYIG